MKKLNVKDRIVQFANRYKLKHANGGAELGTFDFDEATGTVTEQGTEINKALFDVIDENFDELDKGLQKEITDRETAVTTETNRATTAEQTLDKKIAAETTRATGVEEALDTKIDTEISDRKTAISDEVKARDAAIKVEADRAKAAETSLDNKKVNLSGGELADTVVTFPDYTANDNNIASGEKASTLFGKIKKWFGRLKALAFKSTVATSDIDNGSVTNAKLDSSLQNAISKANSAVQNIPSIEISSTVNGTGNAVTALSATGHVITLTKGTTFATQAEANAKYTKPSGGIPASDLAGSIPKTKLDSSVQTSLGKADTAIQSISANGSNGVTASVSGTVITVKGTAANTNTIGVAKLHSAESCTAYTSDDGGATPNAVKKAIIDDSLKSTFNATSTHRGTMSKEDKAKLDAFGTASTYATKTELNAKYIKPSGGIPKTDLASAVQTSLEKADTALQSVPVATTTVLGGVKLGSDATQTVAANSVSTTSGRTYAVQKNNSGQLVVNVPWQGSSYTLPVAGPDTLGGVQAGQPANSGSFHHMDTINKYTSPSMTPFNDLCQRQVGKHSDGSPAYDAGIISNDYFYWYQIYFDWDTLPVTTDTYKGHVWMIETDIPNDSNLYWTIGMMFMHGDIAIYDQDLNYDWRIMSLARDYVYDGNNMYMMRSFIANYRTQNNKFAMLLGQITTTVNGMLGIELWDNDTSMFEGFLGPDHPMGSGVISITMRDFDMVRVPYSVFLDTSYLFHKTFERTASSNIANISMKPSTKIKFGTMEDLRKAQQKKKEENINNE